MNINKQTEWTYEAPTPSDWHKVVSSLLKENKEITTWCLEGDLGVGKTTFIQVLCKQLGVEEPITSPTFSLINTYETKQGQPVYHADFYRIKSPQELAEIGIDYYLHAGNYLLIEWPGTILPYIVRPYLLLDITSLPKGRKIAVKLIKPNQVYPRQKNSSKTYQT